jgi:hypothetical protein
VLERIGAVSGFRHEKLVDDLGEGCGGGRHRFRFGSFGGLLLYTPCMWRGSSVYFFLQLHF